MKRAGFFLCAAVLAGCGGNNDTGANYLPMTGRNVTNADAERAARSLKTGTAAKIPSATNDFGWRILKDVAGKEPKENLFVSPTSIALALGMTANGAGSVTRKEFEKVLGLDGLLPAEANKAYKDLQTVLLAPDEKVRLAIANSIWADEQVEFKPDFLGRNKDFFGAQIRSLDLQKPESVSEVNNWVKQATEEKILKLFDSFDDQAIMVLVNAIYFKAPWETPFEKSATKDAPFTSFDGTKKDVPMMTRMGSFATYSENGETAVWLPFGKGNLAMVVALPKQGSGIGGFVQSLTAKKYAHWSDKRKTQQGTVSIPRFKVEAETGLKPTLARLGLDTAFDPKKADFKPMTDLKEVFINRVIHKTMIQVDEEGAEAAAATGVEMGVTSAPMEPPFKFVADRPFFYAIVEKTTNSVLFTGIYGKP